jgi:hypothetical protein
MRPFLSQFFLMHYNGLVYDFVTGKWETIFPILTERWQIKLGIFGRRFPRNELYTVLAFSAHFVFNSFRFFSVLLFNSNVAFEFRLRKLAQIPFFDFFSRVEVRRNFCIPF